MADGADFAGLLDLAPGSWLLSLVRMLPARDRLSLFQVCGPWASTVVKCAASVTLDIRNSAHNQLTRDEADARRGVITHLLLKRQGLQVVLALRHDSPAPFPTSLSSQMTTLRIHIKAVAGRAFACVDWHALTNLKELLFICYQSNNEDVSMLCAAAELGHMQQLKKLTFVLGGAKLPDDVLERLAHAVGTQLQQLTTDVASLLTYLPVSSALQIIHLDRCRLTSAQAQRLCEHASLHTVHIGCQVTIEGNHSHRTCAWKTVTVGGRELEALLALPLAGTQSICVQEILLGSEEPKCLVLKDILSQHVHKLMRQPGTSLLYMDLPTFTLLGPCDIMLPVLARIHVTCRLRLLCDPQHHGVLKAFWRALPLCVHVILLEKMRKSIIDWSHLWQGLPEHVHTLELDTCVVPAADLCMLVRTAPKHISLLELVARTRPQLDLLEAAGLHDCVPAHVTLRIGHKHSQWL